MNNSDFQELASIRLEEAQVLLRERQYAGAYYLAGYAVECALKACIASKTRAGAFPPKPEKVREYYTHKLDDLIRSAGLGKELEAKCRSTAGFNDKWQAVERWTEQVRYETKIDSELAGNLVGAVSGDNGVLKWLEMFW